MDKDGVCIGRARRLCQIQCMPDCAAMVCAVINNVKEDFESGHSSVLAIRKLEHYLIIQRFEIQISDIACKPLV